MTKSLAIIIVNWNAGQQLRDCLVSITTATGDGFVLRLIVVVDNASTDDSLGGLDSLHLPLTIIRNADNRGFAVACNQGAALCDSDYLLFLNPDTRLYDNSLAVPLEFMESEVNREVGICGIQLIDEQGVVARTCARFPTLSRLTAQTIGLNKLPWFKGGGMHMAEWDHLSQRPVDQVIGAFFFMRRTVFESLNGFDERFFVYFEEVDVSFRAAQAGWDTVFLADAKAFHVGGGTSQQVKATRLFYSLRSRLLYGLKHFTLWQTGLLFGITLLVEPISRTLFSLLQGGMQDVRNTWAGYTMLYLDLPNIFRKSKRHP